MNSIESSSDPIILIRGNSLLDCNQVALELFGYKCRESFLKCAPHFLLKEQQPDGISAPQKMLYILEQVCEEGIYKEVVICRQENGQSFFADLQVISQQMEGGEVLFYSKWLSRQQQSESSRFLQNLAIDLKQESAPALLNINKSGKVIYASPSACSLLQYTQQELITQFQLSDLLVPTKVKSNQEQLLPYQMISGAEQKEGQEAEVVFLSKENKKIKSLISFNRLPQDEHAPDCFQITIKPARLLEHSRQDQENLKLEMASIKQENKNLKRVQKVLKKSLERLRVLAEYSPDVIMQFDRSHRYLFVNSQVEVQLGFKAEDFLGKTHKEIGLPPDFCKNCHEILDAVFESGKNNRVEMLWPNGMWVDWFLIPEFNTRGEVNTVITTARDITKQKQTQLELQKSEQKLSDAFEVTKLSSWEYNFETEAIKLSPNYCDLIGVEQERLEGLTARQYVKQFVLKEDIGKLKYVLDAAAASRSEGFKDVFDYRIHRPDGEVVHVLSSIRLEVSEEGLVLKAYGTSQDITQLRLTEQELEEYRTSLERLVETRTQELKKSEAKLADALRLANLGTWEYDQTIDSFLVSDEALEIIGTTSEIEGGNVIGISRSKEIIYPHDYDKYRETVLRARDTLDGAYAEHTEIRILRSDGEIRSIYLSIKTSRSGSQIKFYGTMQDITDIRRTELEKDRLNAIIETTSDVVAIVQLNGHMLYMNQAGKDFFGIKDDQELLNRTFSSFQSLNSGRVFGRKELDEADGMGTWSGENQYIRHDGVEVPVSQVIVSHKNSEGQVECYSTIIRDISQQKKIEQDLIFKNNELDTFVYRASHDLRGPIATLMGLYNLVQYEIEDEGALKLFDMYNSQVMRLNTITVTLIELTKIKEREFKYTKVDFRKIVRVVYGKLQGMTESQNMLFEQDIDKIEGFVSDEHLLLVILQNMVENSIKYKRQDTDPFVRVEVRQKADSGKVVIKVSDNGIGIDGAIQNKIYNMFFRGNERSSGSGLGLYILKNAVEKLGGRVTLYSVLYKGTTFKIELPGLPA